MPKFMTSEQVFYNGGLQAVYQSAAASLDKANVALTKQRLYDARAHIHDALTALDWARDKAPYLREDINAKG